MNVNKKIMFVVGETSADLHTSAVLEKLKILDKEIEFIGTGGDRMIAVGMRTLYHIKDLAILGFSEVIKHIPFIQKVKKNLIKAIYKENIDTIVLVDYPEFNLSLASKIRNKVKNIIFFISPQIWAWRKNRIKRMKKLIDKMIVVFPFEKEIYQQEKIDVEYVGHPLSERINQHNFVPKNILFEKFSLDDKKEILLLMPGSRLQEVKRILPEVVGAAEKLANKYNFQIVVAGSQNISDENYFTFFGNKNFHLIRNYNYELLRYAKFGIIKSGTSTVEAAFSELPFVVVYSTSSLTHFIGKKFIKINYIAMPNIIAGKKIVEELIQKDVNKENIFKVCDHILGDNKKLNIMKNNLRQVKENLDSNNCSAKTAEIIYSFVNGK
ncbi:MAG: lipid-A-disaccharide synthase [Ignavibacteriales bacterium]|nr:lipid-A-disaccharide synthase [Ignavibacteriales bacterium]